jgi:SAM-dependent methyltransferase
MRSYAYYARFLRQIPHAAIRRLTHKKCRDYAMMLPHFAGKYGLEIGGPSRIFCGDHLIPTYDICKRIDNYDYSLQTVWTNSTNDQEFGAHMGELFVGEACDLHGISNAKYDFVLASHVLEHTANPLRALQEWKRVLIPGGTLLVIVPNKVETFDHRRPLTSFEHLEQDFQANTQEDDLSHLQEILSLHDLDLDPLAGSAEQFQERCLRNVSVRAMHHHVFSSDLLIQLFNYLQMRVLNLAMERPFHIVGFAQKVEPA